MQPVFDLWGNTMNETLCHIYNLGHNHLEGVSQFSVNCACYTAQNKIMLHVDDLANEVLPKKVPVAGQVLASVKESLIVNALGRALLVTMTILPSLNCVGSSLSSCL